MIVNYDNNLPMPFELSFLDFKILLIHPMKVTPNFQPSFQIHG
jgi:hypothetical protein